MESNVASVKMYDFKYERKINVLAVDDLVLPPLSFLDHAVENIRKLIITNNFLKDQDGWTYGNMQLSVGINNTQNNYFLITNYGGQDDDRKAIGPELSVIASPLNVNLMSFNNLFSQKKSYIENKLLESQENGSGWTLHSISIVLLMLVLNPKNLSAIGLRKVVGGNDRPNHKFDMGEWAPKPINNLILNEVEVEGNGNNSDDEEVEEGVNEYDPTDKFVNDEVMQDKSNNDV